MIYTYNFRLEDADYLGVDTSDDLEFYTADTLYETETEKPKDQMYISVFGPSETQFNGYGFAVIRPSSCLVEEELNGMYEAELVVPIVDGNEPNFLVAMNTLKIPVMRHGSEVYQYFRIYKTSKNMDDSGLCEIVVNAKHIFYDLAWRILNPPQSLLNPKPRTGGAALAAVWLAANSYYDSPEIVNFTVKNGLSESKMFSCPKQVNLVKAILSDENYSITGVYGGEIYRDNYYFSIYPERENRRETGVIRYGENMKGIECTVDYSDTYTTVIATDNFGGFYGVGIDFSKSDLFPYPIYKKIEIRYDEKDIPDPNSEDHLKKLKEDVGLWYNLHKTPQISIDIDVAVAEDDINYGGFKNLSNYDVGDKINIYHEKLKINYRDLKVISRQYDVLQKKVTKISINSFRPSISRNPEYKGSITEI